MRAHAHRLGAARGRQARQPGDLLRARRRLRGVRRARRRRRSPRRAPIVDGDGRVLGTHGGVHRFTIGQRKGLGLSSSEPLYVLAIDADGAGRYGRPARGARPRHAHGVDGELDLAATRRRTGRPSPRRSAIAIAAAPARVRALDEGRAELEFDAPQTAVTPWPGRGLLRRRRGRWAAAGLTRTGTRDQGLGSQVEALVR